MPIYRLLTHYVVVLYKQYPANHVLLEGQYTTSILMNVSAMSSIGVIATQPYGQKYS